MNFEPTEDQRHVTDSVERLFARDYDFDVRRRSMSCLEGHAPAIWNTMGEMGLLSLPVPCSHSGMGGGALDMIGTMAAMGEALCIEPYLSTILGARVLANCSPQSRAADVLASVAAGKAKLTLAYLERDSCYEPQDVKCRARVRRGGWLLSGSKIVVQHAPVADWLLVTAATESGEFGIFMVAPDVPGLTMQTYRTLDGTIAAHVGFEEIPLPEDSMVALGERAVQALDEALDFATALVCCEALGVMRYANSATLDHLKSRRQFGVPIGSFQALQHRMVDMTIAQEQARSLTYLACAKVDAAAAGSIDAASRRRFVSACKVNVSSACRRIADEAVQLHGGMGLTDEMKISHAYRRLCVIAHQFGDIDHHLDRFSREEERASTLSS